MSRLWVRVLIIVCLLTIGTRTSRPALAAEPGDEPTPDYANCTLIELDRSSIGTYPVVLARAHNAGDVSITYIYAQASTIDFGVLINADWNTPTSNWSISGERRRVTETREELKVTVPVGYNDVYMDFAFEMVTNQYICNGYSEVIRTIEPAEPTSGLRTRASTAPHLAIETKACWEVKEIYGAKTLDPGSEFISTNSTTFSSKVGLALTLGAATGPKSGVDVSYEVSYTNVNTQKYSIPPAPVALHKVYLHAHVGEWSYIRPCQESMGFVTTMDGWDPISIHWNDSDSFGMHGNNGFADNGFYMSDSNNQAFSYEADIRLNEATGSNPAAGLVFKSDTKSVNHAYGVVLMAGDPGGVKLFQFGPYNVLHQESITINKYETYKLRVDVRDGRIRVYLNGTYLFGVDDPEPNLFGYRGLVAFHTNAVFQNAKTTELTPPVNNFVTNLASPWIAAPDSAAWTYSNDGLRGTGGGNHFSTSASKKGDGRLSADIRLNTPNSTAALTFRVTDPHHPEAGGYVLNFTDAYGGEVKLFKFPYQPLVIKNVPIVVQQIYHVEVEFVGPVIKVYFNGDPMPLITHNDSSYLDGYLGVNIFSGDATFQNVNLSEPTVVNGFRTNLLGPWQTNEGAWTAHAFGLSGSGSANAFYTSNSPTPNTFSYETDVMLSTFQGNEAAAALTFNVQDRLQPMTGSYAVNINTTNGGQVKLFRFPYAPISVSNNLSIIANHSYTLKVVKSGSIIKVYLDGVQVINATDITYTGGYLGLNVFQTSADFQDTTITP